MGYVNAPEYEKSRRMKETFKAQTEFATLLLRTSCVAYLFFKGSTFVVFNHDCPTEVCSLQ